MREPIMCQVRKVNTLGPTGPARNVGGQLFRSVTVKIEQKINGQKRSHRHSWSNLKVTEVIKRMLKDIIKSVVNILEKTSRADLTD